MNWSLVRTVGAKELRETLRDRRTVFIMVVIPVFLYPALLVLIQQLALFSQQQLEQSAARVAVVGDAAEYREILARDSTVRLVEAPPNPVEDLRAGRLDAVVQFPRGEEDAAYGTAVARVLYDASRAPSLHARGVARDQLDVLRDSALARRLAERGLPESFAAPLAVADSSVATAEAVGGYALGRFLPMLLILMTVLGAFYPAIDLAAGEKERRTLEPLLSAAVPAGEIVAGKFAAVTLIAVAAATLNLGSMLLTFRSGVFPLLEAADMELRIAPGALLGSLAALLLLALLFSALFLGIAVRSQSFKEAQSALTPVYIASFLPAILAALPGIPFTAGLALLPVAGVALLLRSLLAGDAAALPALLAVASTIVYVMVAVLFAARSFGREEVLFGGGAGKAPTESPWERMRAWRTAARGVPRPAEALVFVAGAALLFFYVAPLLSLGDLERSLLASQWLLLALPAVLFAVLGPYTPRRTLALRLPSPRALLAALLIVAGGIPIGWGIGWLQSFVLEIPEEFLAGLETLLTADDPARLAWLVFVVALTPAVCEELVFRGVLLQGLSRGLPMRRAVLVSALIFGAFHLSTETVIRFLPTAWIGLLLGYVVWHTRSVYTGMLMHFINNAVTVLLVSFATLQAYLVGPEGEPRWGALLAAPFLLAAGLYLLPRRGDSPEVVGEVRLLDV